LACPARRRLHDHRGIDRSHSHRKRLKVACALDIRTYQKGKKVSNAEMKMLDITGRPILS
jgi:hypothetical protein